MPRVPTYDSPQVTPTTLPQVRLTPQAMPDVAGQQMREAGQAMQRAGSEVSRIALHLAQKANETRADAALTEYVRADTDLRLEALSLKGNDAVNRPDGKSLPDEFVERAGKVASEIEGRLENAAQREAFRRRVTPMQDSMYQRLAVHRVDQERAYAGEQRKATIDTAVYRGGVLWGDKEEVQRSEDTIRLMVEQGLEADGVTGDPQIREARLLAELSPLHSAVINGMADAHRVDLAREYYQRNSASMTLQARDRAMQLIEAQQSIEEAQEHVDRLVAKYGGNITAARKEARSTLSGKTEDDVIARLNAREAERRQAESQYRQDVDHRIQQLILSGQDVPGSLLLDASPQVAKWAQSAQMKGGSPSSTDMAALAMVNDMGEQELAGMDKIELLARYGDKLTDSDMRSLFARHDRAVEAVRKAEAGTSVKLNDQAVLFVAQQAGVIDKLELPKDKPKQLELLRKIQIQAELRIDEKAQILGRQLTEAERRETIIGLRDETAFIPGMWSSSSEAPVVSMSDKDLARAFYNVKVRDATQRVQVASIPEKFSTAMREMYRRNGETISAEQIAALWANTGRSPVWPLEGDLPDDIRENLLEIGAYEVDIDGASQFIEMDEIPKEFRNNMKRAFSQSGTPLTPDTLARAWALKRRGDADR